MPYRIITYRTRESPLALLVKPHVYSLAWRLAGKLARLRPEGRGRLGENGPLEVAAYSRSQPLAPVSSLVTATGHHGVREDTTLAALRKR